MRDKIIALIIDAAGELNITLLNKPATKHFLCYPKGM